MSNIKLLGLSGSLRQGSFNRKLLREGARLFGEADYTEANLKLPLYDGDEEDAGGIPAAVQALADQITGADAILISTPEYNSGISGALKNALDWVSRTEGNPWKDKPLAILSATAGRTGGARTQTMLRWCLTPFRPRILQGPEVLVAQTSDQFDGGDRLINAANEKALTILMTALRAEIGR